MAKKDTYDVDLLKLDETLQAPVIVNALQSKGFCKIKAGVSSEDLDEALRESAKLEDEGRFFAPSILLPEALMGVTGSSRIAKLQRVDAPDPKYSLDGEHLQNLDEVLTDMAMIIEPDFETLGFSCSGRTVGMLHEGSTKSMQEALRDAYNAQIQMTESEAPKWLVDLVRGKILCVISLGPTSGTMQLQPFSDADEAIEVPTDPGDVFLIRQDALIHRHMSKGKCMLMSCFYLSDKTISSKHTLTRELEANLSPATKALIAWAEDRMKKLKSQELDEKEELPADLPAEWHRAMNATYSTGQRIAVSSLALRMPQQWDSEKVFSLSNVGTDVITEIPLMRWDYTKVYDPSPDSWRELKTNQRHGGFADGINLFNNKFFNLAPAEAGGMDPMQRLTLEVGYEAAFEAGYGKKQLLNSFGAVYVSQEGSNEWGRCEKDAGASATGGATSVTCGRVSFIFGMKGPCMTISMEEAGSHLTSYMAYQSVSERGRYVNAPFALFGGGQLQLWDLQHAVLQSSGHMSAIGRCQSYDNVADGYTRSDTVGYGICKRHVEIVDGEAIIKENAVENLGVFAGGFANHSGTSSRFGAPSGSAIVDVLHNAMRTALIEPSDVDCAECNANGHFFGDAVEGRVYNRIFRQDSEAPFLLCATKSGFGNMVDGAGMASLLKMLWCMKIGNANPNQHLLELNPNMEAIDCPTAPSTEAVSLRTRVSYQSDLGIAYAGMQVGLIYTGQMDDPHANHEPKRRDPIAFWPAGGGELDPSLKPRRGYHVCGSMTKWEPVQMKEKNKEYSYTFTLGENRWEDFQVWLDGDSQKVLIPGKAGAVAGPEDGGDDAASLGAWRIDGRPSYKLEEAEDDEEVNFKEVETPDTALIGTQFKIMLKVAGRYLQVSWEKVPLDDKALAAIQDAPAKGSTAEYFVAGTWTSMQLQQMEKDKNVPGLFHFSTPLTWTGHHHEFVIVRDKDWSQAIYPDHEGASEEAEIYGPDENAGTNSWYFNAAPTELGGRPGVVAISFQRTTEAGLDVKKVSWKFSPQAALQHE